MAATLRKDLVFDVHPRESGALEFPHRVCGVRRTAEAGICVRERRNLHRPGNVASELRDFREREQADVGHAGGCVRQARAAYLYAWKPDALDQLRRGSVERARHDDAACTDGAAELRGFARCFHSASSRRIAPASSSASSLHPVSSTVDARSLSRRGSASE